MSSPAELLLCRLEQVTERRPGSWAALCPSHRDKTPSLSIDEKSDGTVLLKCFAGCSAGDITAAVGLSMADLYPPASPPSGKRIVATYDYTDEHGALRYQKVRYVPKDFRIRRPDGNGSWTWKKGDAPPVLYRLPEVRTAIAAGAAVFPVEGEKDADRLMQAGLTATTTIEGAAKAGQRAKWREEYTNQLDGAARVVLLPDNDAPGRAHMKAVAAALVGTVADVRLLELPDLPDKGDVSDWLDAGHTVDELRCLADAAEKDSGRSAQGDERPVIRWVGGELPSIVDQAERAMLSDGGPSIYQRGAMLVRAVRLSADSVTGHIRRQKGALQITGVDGGYLLERFTQAAQWLKHDARTKAWLPTNAHKQAVETYLSRLGRWNCPTLTGVIEAPTLRPDGSILDTPGYDPGTGLIFDAGAAAFTPIPDQPTKADADQAVKTLLAPFKYFPFVANHDRAVLLAAILTALVRPSLRSAPMFGFTAPVMGSGKSLLADCVALIATGRRAAAWTYTDDHKEERKHTTAALLAGDAVICIDNVSSPLDSDRLCSILTQETIRDRVLGATREVTLPTAATWLATGNNLEFRGDLATRVLLCCLDAQTEQPEEREFDTDLLEWIPANRPTLVKAALTILRAYHVAGRPKQPIKQFGRFETWSDLVRAALVWAGVDDPCKARVTVAAADSERQQFGALLAAWHAVFSDERVTAADVILSATPTATGGEPAYSHPNGNTLRNALLAVAGDGERINTRIFGRYLAKRRSKIIDGYQLKHVGERDKVAVWRVETASKSAPTLASAQQKVRGFRGFRGFCNRTREKCQFATEWQSSRQ